MLFCIKKNSIHLYENESLGIMGKVWPASVIMSEYLHYRFHESSTLTIPSKILELGGGTGVSGLFAAKILPSSLVIITDLEEALPLITTNIKLNSMENVTCHALNWSQPIDEMFKNIPLVIATDVVYYPHLGPILVNTLKNVVQSPDQECLISYQIRQQEKEFPFWSSLGRFFIIEIVDWPDLWEKYRNQGKGILKITRRSVDLDMDSENCQFESLMMLQMDY